MKRNVFSVQFYVRRTKVNRSGESPIMVSLNVNGDREMFAAKLSVKPDIWDANSGRAIGRTAAINELNGRLTDIQILLKRHFYDIEQQQGYATAEQVKNAYMGITAKQESLMPVYREFLEETKKMIGIKKSQKTYDKYERCYRRVVEFMKKKYNSTDIPLRELKPKFLTDFEVFLTTDYGCCQNTTYKFLQLFRMVILKAQRDGVNFPDPYLNFTMKKEKVDRGYLNEEEVIKIATKPITLQRLDQVRDVFIFACYTGLAYADIASLRADNIQKMFDGKEWIITHRQKTKTNVNVPLLPMARKILNKYQGHLKDDEILPVLSNQKMNAYLKEIAEICGIEKNLTFHLARHTFYTSNLLSLAS